MRGSRDEERRGDEASGRSREGDPYRILFVCTGNTCRSPMAEAIGRELVEERGWSHVEVSSAGVAAGAGAPASAGARSVARAEGLDLSDHRSRSLTVELVEEADLVLAMTPTHRSVVEATGGEGKVVLLGDFAAGADAGEDQGEGGWEVPDPFGGDDAVYVETFHTLREMIRRAMDRLEAVVSP